MLRKDIGREIRQVFTKKPWVPVALLVGVLLLLFGVIGGGCEDSGEETVGATSESDAYRHALETQLASALSQVEGVGRAQVALTLETGEQYVYDGSKKVGSVPPRVLGAVVICEGGGADRVRQEVTALVGALLDLPANHIHVSKMD